MSSVESLVFLWWTQQPSAAALCVSNMFTAFLPLVFGTLFSDSAPLHCASASRSVHVHLTMCLSLCACVHVLCVCVCVCVCTLHVCVCVFCGND